MTDAKKVKGMDIAESITTSISEWESLRDALTKVYGFGSILVLFNIGYGIGTDIAEKMKGGNSDRSAQFSAFGKAVQQRGWGNIGFKGVDFKDQKGRIIVSDSPFRNGQKKTLCYEVKGIIAGFLENLFNKKFSVLEEKCMSKGDDECEFVFEGERGHGY